MLYTQCRGCGEVFIIEAEHLTLARGQVRCHVCGTVFDALQTLTAEQPLEGEDLLLHDDGHAPPLLTRSFQVEDEAITAEQDETEIDRPDASSFQREEVVFTDEVALDAAATNFETNSIEHETPDFLTPKETTLKADLPYEDDGDDQKSGQKWWAMMSVVLAVALLWQAKMALAEGRMRLPDTAWGEKICDTIGCAELSRPIDLTNVSLVSRNIRSHPGRDNALIISASMIKTHSEDNRFPALSIRLSDLDGQVIAMRRFQADEYLTPDIVKAGFINNTLVPITLEIQNPGEHAVAFEIGFSQP